MVDHLDEKTDVEPDESEADERAGGRYGEPRTDELVCRLKLLHSVHLQQKIRHSLYRLKPYSCFIRSYPL